MKNNRFLLYRYLVVLLALWCIQVFADESVKTVLIHGPEVDLTIEDIQKALLSVPVDIRQVLLTDRQKLVESINSTYLTKVAAHRALEKGLDKKPEVQARIWNRRLNILANAELDRVVAESLSDEEALESLAKEEYLAHKKDYSLPERVHAAHILIKGEDDTAKAKVENIRSEIISGNISFEDAAKKFSQDNHNASKGGDLGVFSHGRMVKPFEMVAFSLDVGQVSEPVKTRFGYHLIKVLEKFPAEVRPYEKVKQAIVNKLKKKMEGKIRRDYWLRLENDPNLEVNHALINEFVAAPYLR